eukprot:GEMP01005530.1.p1 GENE.GEMP01005530.1~~GEMP01005530.1.p1  ORF type:complete len:426 (+),score=58.32 GEMP01005530.1:271-1548(+)
MCVARPEGYTDAVVVVDPYSSGAQLVDAILEAGSYLIAVQSSLLLDEAWLKQFKTEKYHASIVHKNIEDTVEFIRNLNVPVRAIFPGSEPGVTLAEELQRNFEGVPRNLEDSGIRRHKHAMHQRLRQVGIRGIAELCTGDVTKAIAWIFKNTDFPVIVKPPMSGGSDGVHFCHSIEDVTNAFAMEYQKCNVNGEINSELLVQEFIDGPEYVIDCVSLEGRHVVLGIWRYSKTRNPETKAITYEYSEFLESRGPVQERLLHYIFTVLDALGIRFGASHSEVIIDSKGPCLIETGARMHGAMGPKGTELATGIPQYDLLVDIALHGARLFNQLYAQTRYIIKSNLLYVDLRNFKCQGHLARPIEDALRKISTIKEMKVIQPGDLLRLTRDLATSPGGLLLTDPDKNTLFMDLRKIRELEDTTLYETL